MSKRGLQLGAQTEYFDFNYRGLAKAEYMPYDQMAERERYAFMVQHWHTLGQGFSASVNYNRVSDNFYCQDMSSRLVQTSQTQLPQQVSLAYTPAPWLQTNLQVLQYQTLQTDPSNPVAVPYFLEPQLNLIGFKPDVLGTDLTLIGQYTRFINPAQVQGDRLVVYPQFSLPIVHPSFSFVPKIGLHATEYALNNQPTASDPTNIFSLKGISKDMPSISTEIVFGSFLFLVTRPTLIMSPFSMTMSFGVLTDRRLSEVLAIAMSVFPF